MYAIIDIGSNTIRLVVYQLQQGRLRSMFQKKVMAGLGSYVNKDNNMKEEGIQRAIEVLKDFQSICQYVNVNQMFIIATASFRNVDNTREIVRRIYKEVGVKVHVLSGEEEAMFDFMGATHMGQQKRGMIVDIGGGSMELVEFDHCNAKDAVSIPLGSLNMYYRFVSKLFPTKEEEREIRKNVRRELRKQHIPKQKIIVGVGGTYRASMKLYNDFYQLEPGNCQMDVDRFGNLLDKLNNGKKVKIHRILRVVPDRVHTVIPGMIMMDELNKYYHCKRIEISSWGVREGYLLSKLQAQEALQETPSSGAEDCEEKKE